jgi:hypothetical protein
MLLRVRCRVHSSGKSGGCRLLGCRVALRLVFQEGVYEQCLVTTYAVKLDHAQVWSHIRTTRKRPAGLHFVLLLSSLVGVAQVLRAEGIQKEARSPRQVAMLIDHAPASYEETISKLLTWELLKTPITLRHGSIAVSGCSTRTREMLLFKHVQYMLVNIVENDYSQGTNDIGC